MPAVGVSGSRLLRFGSKVGPTNAHKDPAAGQSIFHHEFKKPFWATGIQFNNAWRVDYSNGHHIIILAITSVLGFVNGKGLL